MVKRIENMGIKPKKLSDYEKEDRGIISNEIDAFASMINFEGGYDNEFRDVSNRKGLEDLFGICSSCMYLNYCITKFGKIFSSCSIFKISLIGGDRMTDCTSYNKNGQMTLNEMKEIAYLIEVNTKKIGLLK